MPDRFVVRAVVVGLLVVGLAVILGAIALSIGNHSIPDSLWTLAGTAVGAVAGILSKTNTEPGPIQPVQVMNQPAAPVPVADADEPPQMTDERAKAERRAHIINNTTNVSADLHATARRVALSGEKRRPWNVNLGRVVPDCGTPPVG